MKATHQDKTGALVYGAKAAGSNHTFDFGSRRQHAEAVKRAKPIIHSSSLVGNSAMRPKNLFQTVCS